MAQVCVIPESCWNAGLDQSESQGAYIQSVDLGGRQVVEKKTKFLYRFIHSHTHEYSVPITRDRVVNRVLALVEFNVVCSCTLW